MDPADSPFFSPRHTARSKKDLFRVLSEAFCQRRRFQPDQSTSDREFVCSSYPYHTKAWLTQHMTLTSLYFPESIAEPDHESAARPCFWGSVQHSAGAFLRLRITWPWRRTADFVPTYAQHSQCDTGPSTTTTTVSCEECELRADLRPGFVVALRAGFAVVLGGASRESRGRAFALGGVPVGEVYDSRLGYPQRSSSVGASYPLPPLYIG